MDALHTDYKTVTRPVTPNDSEDIFSSNATTTSSMDQWEIYTKRNRHSKPCLVEEWQVLKFSHTEHKWKSLCSMPASGPLVKAVFINALNDALGGSSGASILGVTFVSNSSGGVNVVYTISNGLNFGISFILKVSYKKR